MYKMTVRQIEDATALKLKKMAKEKNMSLEQLVRDILTGYATAPELKEIEEKYIAFTTEIVRMYQDQIDTLSKTLEINTYAINRFIEIMEGGMRK